MPGTVVTLGAQRIRQTPFLAMPEFPVSAFIDVTGSEREM